jgi:hypothetical protein
MRYFLGVGKYTPNAAVIGEMGWKPSSVKQWGSVVRHFCRMSKMDSGRINQKIFDWARRSASSRCKNQYFRICKMFRSIEININDVHVFSAKRIVEMVENKLRSVELDKWKQSLNRNDTNRNTGGNKLRTYSLFKDTPVVEKYLKYNLPFHHRSSLTKFRCGVAPIRLETGRYENLHVNDRTCFNCTTNVEDEIHVILHCPVYNDIREDLLVKIRQINTVFDTLSDMEKLCYVLNNFEIVKYSAKACYQILQLRRLRLYRR